jgi:hypothetical protein
MHVPRDVERLIDEGASLSADDARALERGLEQKPDDLDARARLLGYHHARWREVHEGATHRQLIERFEEEGEERDDSFLEVRARYALWLATNAPRAPLATHPFLRLHTMEAPYSEVATIWRRHASADPPDATLLGNAIAFFSGSNASFAYDVLLARAEQRFPGDPRWASFRRERRAQELCHELRGSSHEGEGEDSEGRRVGSEEDLAEIEQLLPELDPQSGLGPRLHEAASELALSLGHTKRARRHAEEMLISNAGDPRRRHGDAVHDGHLMLGRIALRADDVVRARAHLILAGQAGATGFVPLFGPDLRLARDLLARGEREVVVRYLTLAREFWERDRVDDWIAQIRAGRIPDKLRTIR